MGPSGPDRLLLPSRQLAAVRSLLLDLATIFVLSVAAAVLRHRHRLASPMGLLLAILIAGPHALRLLRNDHDLELLAEIGAVLVLFVIGLEISITDLGRLKRFIAIGGTAKFFGTAVVVTRLQFPGLLSPQNLDPGFVVALLSRAIVLRALQERSELEPSHSPSILPDRSEHRRCSCDARRTTAGGDGRSDHLDRLQRQWRGDCGACTHHAESE